MKHSLSRRAVLGTLSVLLAAGAAATSHAEPTGQRCQRHVGSCRDGHGSDAEPTGNVKIFTDEIHLNGIMQAPTGS